MINFANYHHEQHPHVLVINVTGQLDTPGADYLLECIQGMIERGETHILVNCEEVSTIHSMGLAMLVRAHSRLKGLGGELAIANASGIVAETLRIVNFDRLFHLFDSVDQAAESMEKHA